MPQSLKELLVPVSGELKKKSSEMNINTSHQYLYLHKMKFTAQFKWIKYW